MHSYKKKFRILLTTNVLISTIFLIFLLTSFNSKNVYTSLQTQELKILAPKTGGEIHLGFADNSPIISMKNSKGELSFEMQGANQPRITMFKDQQPIAFFAASQEGGVDFILNDKNLIPKVHLTSSQIPGVFLKNDLNKTVGSWTIMQDGGSGFGLADATGLAATLVRGGLNPSLAFFSGKAEPLAAFGIMQKTPHLLVSGQLGNEGILIHGGHPNSLLVVDEEGKVKILISKKGVFQGKEQKKPQLKKGGEKVFSLEDHERLFPDIKLR